MRKVTGILFIVLSLVSCTANDQKTEISIQQSEITPVEIKYAKNFTLEAQDDHYILSILNPANGEKEYEYIIAPNKNKRIISLTPTLNGMMDILDAENQLIGVSDIELIFSPEIKKRYLDGKIKEYGDQSLISLEKIISEKADIIFCEYVTAKFPHLDKLKKLGVQVLPIHDWNENHPLAKAEWIKVIGAITGHMEEAQAHFDTVEKEYNRLKHEAVSYSIHPSVLCGNLIGDIWYTPSGNNYFAVLIADAQGNYKYSYTKGPISLEFSMERVIKDNGDTDIWLNPGFKSKSQILKMNPHAKFLGPFKNGKVFCYSNQMNKFWEQTSAYPDRVLSDLIIALHPEYNNGKEFHYYQEIN